MPIYEYKCKNCGNCFERIVFPSDDENSFCCDKCGKKELQKVVSAFSCLGSDGDSGNAGCAPGKGFS